MLLAFRRNPCLRKTQTRHN